MTLWLLVALLSAVVVALFAWPLIRPRALAADAGRDLAVYRDQLAELDREVGRGLLLETEASAARLEIQRRLLAAADRPAPLTAQADRAARAPISAALLFLLLPAAAIAIYLDLGAPTLPAMPFASRAPADQNLTQLVDALSARMQADPSDPKGWILLAGAEAKLGRFKESAAAYAQAIARRQAKGEPGDGELQSLYGEALTAADGQVTPAAKAAFDAALAIDAKNPRARFYLAEAEAEAGHLDAALAQWVALEADSPADAPWQAMLTDRIETAAKRLGRDPATLPGHKPAPTTTNPPGPSADDLANAATMTPAKRAAFIDSMVAGLAARLHDQPNDIDGWMKLGTAYDRLGRSGDARAAWREAATRAPERLDAQLAYAGAVAATADGDPLPGDFAPVVDRIRNQAPGNGLGLYCAGLLARANGDKAAARAFWQQVLPLIPEASAQRKELEAKIAALGQ